MDIVDGELSFIGMEDFDKGREIFQDQVDQSYYSIFGDRFGEYIFLKLSEMFLFNRIEGWRKEILKYI